MPWPELLYAQVVKTVRRRRLVRVRHRVVCGTLEAVQQVLPACGWQINTAFVEVRSVGRKEAELPGRPRGKYEPCNAVFHKDASRTTSSKWTIFSGRVPVMQS